MRPFEGIRVLDFTHVLAGPFSTYQLAVMGADVVKIEAPDNPDMMRPEGHSPALGAQGLGTAFVCQNGGKRSLALDVTRPGGLAVAQRLIGGADVLVENFRKGTMERLGLGYEAAAAIRPDIVYCSITGFGHTGPKADHPAYDPVIQADSGLMAATGTPDCHPVRVGPATLDYGTGAQAAFAIAAALFQRSRTGRGQRIDVAMTDAALMLMTTHVMATQMLGRTPVPFGNVDPVRAGYSCYETAEGLLVIGAHTNRQIGRLWRALGRDDIAVARECCDHGAVAEHFTQDRALLSEILRGGPAARWEDLLNAAGVPAARVRRIDETLAEAQIASRGVLAPSVTEPEGRRALKTPVAAFGYGHDGPAVDRPAPRLGEHSRAILAESGYGPDEIAGLERDGAVVAA